MYQHPSRVVSTTQSSRWRTEMTNYGKVDAAVHLESLRAELDSVDIALLDVLRARMDCCRRIARHKRDHGVPMMQPHRIGFVQERVARYAESHSMSRSFLRTLYDLIIEEACRVENQIINERSTSRS